MWGEDLNLKIEDVFALAAIEEIGDSLVWLNRYSSSKRRIIIRAIGLQCHTILPFATEQTSKRGNL